MKARRFSFVLTSLDHVYLVNSASLKSQPPIPRYIVSDFRVYEIYANGRLERSQDDVWVCNLLIHLGTLSERARNWV